VQGEFGVLHLDIRGLPRQRQLAAGWDGLRDTDALVAGGVARVDSIFLKSDGRIGQRTGLNRGSLGRLHVGHRLTNHGILPQCYVLQLSQRQSPSAFSRLHRPRQLWQRPKKVARFQQAAPAAVVEDQRAADELVEPRCRAGRLESAMVDASRLSAQQTVGERLPRLRGTEQTA